MPVEGPGLPAGSLAGSQWNDNATLGSTTALHEAIQTVESYLRAIEVPKRIEHAWKRVCDAAKVPAGAWRVNNDANDLNTTLGKTITEGLSRIETLLKAKPTKPFTYADAAKGRATTGEATATAHREVIVPARRLREIIVDAGTETPAEKRRNGKELVEDLNKDLDNKIIAARRLRSGDILVTTADKTTRQSLLKDTSWLQAFGQGAKVRQRSYVVLAHGVRIDQVDMGRQEEAIKAIYEQNAGLQAKVDILAVTWAKKALKWKKVAPLYISVAEPEQANYLIDTGVVLDYQLHDCEPFVGACHLTQCFRCYEYNHTAKTCSNTPKCGHCAAPGHETNLCNQRHDPENHRCAACGTPEAKHTAWSSDCPVRQKWTNKAKRAYSQRATRFQEPKAYGKTQTTRATSPSVETASATSTSTAITLVSQRDACEPLVETMEYTQNCQAGQKRSFAVATVEDSSEDDANAGYTVVSRRGPGRPRWNNKAAPGSQDIQKLLTQSSQTTN
jgi:hypothetical protein